MKGNRRQFGLLVGLMVGAPVVLQPDFSFAQSTNSWAVGSDGKWETGSNWSLGVAPTNTHSAILITNAATKIVTLDSGTPAGNRIISNLTISAPGVALNTLQLTNAGTVTPLQVINALTIGAGGTIFVTSSILRVESVAGTATLDVRGGTLTIAGGAVTTDKLVVTNSAGRVSLNGASLTTKGTTVSNTISFAVDNGAALNLVGGTHFFNDALIINNASSAVITNCTLRVQGAQGFSMDGSVSFLAGSTVVTTNAGTFVGAFAQQSAGTLTVNGATLLAGDMTVGQYSLAQGTVILQAGNITLLGALNVGLGGGLPSTGTVVVAGGQLTVTNDTTILGDKVANSAGRAQMTVSNGTVLLRDVFLGKTTGARGSLTAVGGTVLVSSNLTLGDCATTAMGTMLVAGGNVFVTNAAHTATLDVRNGTVTINSGTLVVDKLVVTNACGHIIHTGGTLSITSTNLDLNLSAAGDGIPNGWKQQYGFDPFDPSIANADPDGDGLSNLQEFLAGSNPVADIKTIIKEGNNIRVTWQAAAAKTNALQRSPGINGSYSNNFADIFIVTNNVGSVTNYLDSGAATNVPSRFYRVRLVP